jgi:uncharacterized protein YecE (DUF72 family)
MRRSIIVVYTPYWTNKREERLRDIWLDKKSFGSYVMVMKNSGSTTYIGTSGWSYPHWKGVFYPDDWPKSRWFEYYRSKFSTVEVNATFYRSFKDQTYQNWYEKAPQDFKYVLKAPKWITHRKYLIEVEPDIEAFWQSASLLKEKLGMILLQLAPSTPYDPRRLKRALTAFQDSRYVAVEFRHKRWLTQETKNLLQEMGSTFCNADSPKSELNNWLTSDTAYIRLHGHEHWYGYEYSNRELKNIYTLIKKMEKLGAKTIYVFFNNDIGGFAPKNALALMDILTR